MGGFEVCLPSGAPLALRARKAQALLAYLAMRPGQSHPRDKLAALLWADKSDAQARDRLRHAVLDLRRALDGAAAAQSALRLEGRSLSADPARVGVDVAAFEACVAEGTPAALERAAELYRGDLLLGFVVNEPLFEEWLVAERERLREMALDALARLLAIQAETASTERAIQTAVRLLALDPLQEAVHRALMRLYARQGRRGAALKQYQVCVSALQRELGTEPEAETKQLYQALLRRSAEGTRLAEVGADRDVRGSAVGPAPPDLPTTETPLIGREDALLALLRGLEDARHGRGHVATVIGEAGIGKTRLVTSLAADALSRKCRVLIGRCHESDSILPFGPWVEACRTGGISSNEEVLAALHPARRAELTRLFPEAGMAGLPTATDSALPMFESMTELLERVAAQQPLVVVLEDVHWADETSLRLLAYVSRRIAAWPVLLVATARQEDLADASMARRTLQDLSAGSAVEASMAQRPLGDLFRSQVVTVALSPLSRADTARLVRALAHVGSDGPTFANIEEQIWVMSEGNPFVAVEAMHALDQATAWEAARDMPGKLALPASVRELVARRLDRLSARSQEMAAVAAVIGRLFSFTVLQSASGMDERSAAEAVEEMVRRHVLQAVGNQLDFTHDRIRDVVYGRLLPPRRLLIHRAVAEALEAADARDLDADALALPARDGLSERIEQLAHHALHGELREKAVHYLRQAGLRSAARSALMDARVRFEQALGVLATLPESRSNLEQAFEIRLELRPVLTQLGEVGRTFERLREAETLAERLDDDVRRGQVYAFLTNIRAMVGELDDALVSGTRALALAERLGDMKLRILATTYLEVTRYYRGEYEEVIELVTGNLTMLPADAAGDSLGMPAPPSVYERGLLLLAMAELGRFSEAAEYEVEVMRLAERTGHAYTIGMACRTAAMVHLNMGDWAKALSRLERGIAVLRTVHVPLPLPILIAASAWALARIGEVTEAVTRLQEGEQLLDRQAESGLVGQSGWVYHALGRACLSLGRLDEARRLCDRALASCPQHPGFAAHALHLLGDIENDSGRSDAASGEANYRKALALAEPHGMRPLVAHCHLGLGKLFVRSGRLRESRDSLTTALTMYGEMGMPFWLEQARAEMRTIS